MQKTLTSKLKKWVNIETYNHCIGVMNIMIELSDIYSLNKDKAYKAGLLHDIGKNLSLEDQLKYSVSGSFKFKQPVESEIPYLHGKAGAYLAKTETGITDDEILEAISTHTTYDDVSAKSEMLSWCLRIADMLAPEKNWNGMEKLKITMYSGKLNEAKLLITYWVKEYFTAKGQEVHPNFDKQINILKRNVFIYDNFFNRELG